LRGTPPAEGSGGVVVWKAMTSTASLLSAGEILKQDSLGRVRTPLGKRQELLDLL